MSDAPSPRPARLTVGPGNRPGYATAVLLLPTGQSFTEQLNILRSAARQKYIEQMTEQFPGLDAEELETRLEAAAAETALAMAGGEADAPPPTRKSLLVALDEQTQAELDATPKEVLEEAAAMLLRPDLMDLIMADIAAIGVVGEQDLAATTYLAGSGRLLSDPPSCIVQGTSSSGKSYVVSRTGDLFPVESILRATDITANALYYLPPGSVMHRLVLGGERRRGDGDDHAEVTRAMREMISARELRKAVPVKGPGGGGMETKVIWQPGPIAYIESTTATEIFDEDANRCLLLGTDETAEQTARIVLAQARSAARASPDIRGIIDRHHAMQRQLRRVEVRIPFAEIIGAAVPTARPEARRAMPQILAMIRAVATLHQRQRAAALEHGDCIAATVHDYVIARTLLTGPLGRSLGGGLPDAVARFGVRLTGRYGAEVFDSTKAASDDPYLSNKSKVNEYLGRLAAAGVAECIEPSKGPKPAKWRIVGEVPRGGAAWLPTVDALEAYR